MIDDDDNSLIDIAMVAFVLFANAGDGSRNKHNVIVDIKSWWNGC